MLPCHCALDGIVQDRCRRAPRHRRTDQIEQIGLKSERCDMGAPIEAPGGAREGRNDVCESVFRHPCRPPPWVYSCGMPTVDPPQPSAEHLESLLEFETLIADLSSRFINLPPGEVDREIEDALRRVCELPRHRSRGALAVVGRDPGRHRAHPRLPRPGRSAASRAAAPGAVPLVRRADAGRPHGRRSLRWRSCRRRPPSTGRAAAVSASSRACASRSRSGASRPSAPWRFNTLREERDWPDALVKRLQLVAQVFTNALARRRHELSLQESEERLALAADSAEAGLWTLDYGTGVFWATARARAIFGYSPDEIIDMDASRGVGSSRRLGAGAGRHRAVRACGRARRRGIPDRPPGRRPRAVDRLPRTAPFRPDRRAGAPDGRLHRRHRAEACRRGASRERGSPGRRAPTSPASAFYEVDFGERTAFVDDRLRDLCGVPPDREQGLQPVEFWMEHLHPDDRARVLEQREQLHDGRLEQLSHRVSLPAPGPRGEVDPSHGPRRRARRRRTRGQDVRRPPRHHGATASARRPCGSRTRRSRG